MDSHFYVKPDLTTRRSNLLEHAKANVADPESRANKLIDFVCCDRNCNISLKTRDGRHMIFSTEYEFERSLDYIEDTAHPYTEIWRKLDNDFRNSHHGIKVVNLTGMDIEEWKKDPTHLYIGRANGNTEASPWANDFKVEVHGREMALQMYRERVTATPSLMSDLGSLCNRSLGCFCVPDHDCHGLILVDLVEQNILC